MTGLRTEQSDLGIVDELVTGEIDLAERALANQAAESVVADRLEVLVREFTAKPREGRSQSTMIWVVAWASLGWAGLLEKFLVRAGELYAMSIR